MLTTEQRQAFQRDGFLLLDTAFDAAAVEHITAVALEIERRGRVVDFAESDRATPLALGVRPADLPDLDDLTRDERLTGPASLLLGDEVVHLETRVSLKRPGSGGFGWHQEYRYWKGRGYRRPDIVSALIYLEPAAVENGCLRLVRGSHRAALLTHRSQGGQEVVAQALVDRVRGETALVHAEGPGGTTVFFHSKTLHSSVANDSEHSRLALVVTYAARTACPVDDAPTETPGAE